MSKAKIYYRDIGDYLNRDEKLALIKKYGSVSNQEMVWSILSPNEHGDWISLRNDLFSNFIRLDIEKKFDLKSNSIFITYSLGLATGRDAWVYNYSRKNLIKNVKNSLDFYNEQSNKFKTHIAKKGSSNIDSFIDTDPTKLSWNRNLKEDLAKFKLNYFVDGALTIGYYRPFCKQNLYFEKDFNAMLYQNRKLFPNPKLQNFVIAVSGIGAQKEFSSLISSNITDLQVVDKAQCFPLYYYDQRQKEHSSLFDKGDDSEFVRRDGISDFILDRAKKQYGKTVTKEDIFYYVYGFLHSPEYRIKFANDLKKMLPRIPLVDEPKDFWKFSKAGRALAELHINYESVPPAPGVIVLYDKIPKSSINKAIKGKELDTINYRVEKMRFPSKEDKSTIIYNHQISITNIPLRAYEYVVNGKSAIEWIMERYQVTTHKESGIKNDPNDWALEVGNPKYILNLLLSIINLSLQTIDIVEGLPQLKFE